MNSAINYYSAAQLHADAIRDARRGSLADVPARERRAPAQASWVRSVLARRSALRPLLVRL